MPGVTTEEPLQAATSYSRLSPEQAAADAIPILVDGTYHLFHLTTPPGTVHHPPRLRSVWSRLRSKDLKQWTRDENAAILPGASPSDPDADGAWTGSAVLGPDGNMHIFYTGYNLSQNGRQVIIQASSSNKHGSTFSKAKEPITISTAAANRSAFEDIDFRDPYVFYNELYSTYWMIVGTRLSTGPYWTRGCLALLTSPDLKSWDLNPEPLYAPNDMHCPECPELFSLPNGKWYLVYSRFAAPNAGTVYRIADSPNGPFRVPRDGSNGRLDGRRWYAAKSCPKAGDPSKRIYFGWVGDYHAPDGRWLWGGDMGVPREVSANEDGTLRVDPVSEGLGAKYSQQSDQLVASSKSSSVLTLHGIGQTSTKLLDPSVGNKQNYSLTFEISSYDALSFGILLRTDAEMRGHRIIFKPTTQDGILTITLYTDLSPLDDFWADQYSLHIPRHVDGPEIVRHDGVKLDGPVRLFVSGDLIQFFCGGRSISYRIPQSMDLKYETAEHSLNGNSSRTELGFFVEDGDVAFQEIKLLDFDGKLA